MVGVGLRLVLGTMTGEGGEDGSQSGLGAGKLESTDCKGADLSIIRRDKVARYRVLVSLSSRLFFAGIKPMMLTRAIDYNHILVLH